MFSHCLHQRRIDVRQFIIFGVVFQVIRRVHEYPICREGHFADLMNGKNHMDAICCTRRLSRKTVLKRLEGVDYTILYK